MSTSKKKSTKRTVKHVDAFETDPVQVFDRIASELAFLSNLAAREVAIFRTMCENGDMDEQKVAKVVRRFRMDSAYEKALFKMKLDFVEAEKIAKKTASKKLSDAAIVRRTAVTVHEVQKRGQSHLSAYLRA